MAFEAKYEGRCADCLEHIHIGDLVQFGREPSFGHRRLVAHVDCEVAGPMERAEVVCPECRLIKLYGCKNGL